MTLLWRPTCIKQQQATINVLQAGMHISKFLRNFLVYSRIVLIILPYSVTNFDGFHGPQLWEKPNKKYIKTTGSIGIGVLWLLAAFRPAVFPKIGKNGGIWSHWNEWDLGKFRQNQAKTQPSLELSCTAIFHHRDTIQSLNGSQDFDL